MNDILQMLVVVFIITLSGALAPCPLIVATVALPSKSTKLWLFKKSASFSAASFQYKLLSYKIVINSLVMLRRS
jgi:hypothetical protein